MSVAEAMLAGCIPVVARAGALPEVVGEAGVQLDRADPEAIADAVRHALAAADDQRRRARERVLERFPVSARRDGLFAAIEEAIRRRSGARARPA